MKLELADDVQPLVSDLTDLDIRADFVDRDKALESYLNRGFGNSYDFGQTS